MRPAFRMSFGGAWSIRRIDDRREAAARAALRARLETIAAPERPGARREAAIYLMAAYRLPTDALEEIAARLERENPTTARHNSIEAEKTESTPI